MSRITVERHDDRIRLSGWIGPSTPSKCKAVGGGRFRNKEKSPTGEPLWEFPLTLGVCRAVRAQFGEALDIGPALNRWAREAIAAENDLGTLAQADDADLARVPEGSVVAEAMSTRKYQRVAAVWGAKTGSFLLADQQGLGKTVETLGTILEHLPEEPERTQWHIVFSPSVAVETVWSAEVLKFLSDLRVEVLPLVGTLAERERLLAEFEPLAWTEHVFVVTNLEAARIKPTFAPDDDKKKRPKYLTKDALVPSLHSRIWDTVVVDECQRALIRTSGKMTQTRAGFSVLSRNSERRIALSGTPMRGKPEQLWGTLNWLRPDVYTSYWNWIDRYFQRTSNGFSNYILDGFQPGGEDRLVADLKDIILRRTKAEVLPELPAKTYAGSHLDPRDQSTPHGVWLDLHPEQRKQIRDMEEEGVLVFEDEELLIDGTLPVYTRGKQFANAVHTMKNGVLTPTLDSPKYQWLLSWLEEADGEKIVVASQFTAFIDVIAEGLRAEGYSVAVLTGKTSQKKRTELVRQFQDTDEVQVFLLNTRAGGVALTLDSADYLVLLDETTVPDDQEQVEDRIHRTSRIHNVTIYYLRTLGSMDEEIAWVSAARASVQQYLLDGARGVEAAKRLFYNQEERDNG